MNALTKLLDDMLAAKWDLQQTGNNGVRAKAPDGKKIIHLTAFSTHRRGVENARREFTHWQRTTARDEKAEQERLDRVLAGVYELEKEKEPDVTAIPIKYQPEDHTPPEPAPKPPPQRAQPIPAPPKNVCPVCRKTFPTSQGLNGHMTSHGQVICPDCGIAVGANGIGSHRRIHKKGNTVSTNTPGIAGNTPDVAGSNGHHPATEDDSLKAVTDDLIALASLMEKETLALAARIEKISQRTGDVQDFKDKLKALLS